MNLCKSPPIVASLVPMTTYIRLPDLLAEWPFMPTFNPYHETICKESSKWIESYHAFDAKAQSAFNRCNFGFFATLAYPHADPAHFRVACDLMNYFFVFDDFSDRTDGASVRILSAIIKDALSEPCKPRPAGESVLGDMAKSFWTEALQFTTPSSARRFVKNFSAYTDAVAEEAADRDLGRVRNISDYLDLRRGTIGVRPSFDFFLLPYDLPDDVVSHPCIESLVMGAIDMTILANDVYSYNKEQACGADTHNMVSVAMCEKGLDVQSAMDYIGQRYREIAQKFLEDMNNIPTFSEPVDQLVAEYVFGLGNWVTTNIEWSFKSERYFGTKGQEVKKQLVFELRPKQVNGES